MRVLMCLFLLMMVYGSAFAEQENGRYSFHSVSVENKSVVVMPNIYVLDTMSGSIYTYVIGEKHSPSMQPIYYMFENKYYLSPDRILIDG